MSKRTIPQVVKDQGALVAAFYAAKTQAAKTQALAALTAHRLTHGLLI